MGSSNAGGEKSGAISKGTKQPGHRRGLAFLLLALLGAILTLASCAGQQAPPQLTATGPVWRVGDRWHHTWTAGAERGKKTAEVLSVRQVGGVPFYVLRVDTVTRYYTLNLHWAATLVESRVAARAQPPQPLFAWPLEVGKRWEYQGIYEDQERREQLTESYAVLGTEQIEVPAGTFWTLKLSRQGVAGSLDQYWYSPDVRWYVKWLGRRGDEEFQEILEDFAAGTDVGPPAPSPERPTGGRD